MGIAINLQTDVFSNRNLGKTIVKKDRFVSYIKGDGASYIDTQFTGYRVNAGDTAGVIPANLPRLVVEFEQDGTSETVQGSTIYSNNNNGGVFAFVSASNKLNMYGKGAKVTNYNLQSGKHTLDYGSVKTYLDGNLIADNSDMANQYRINNYNTNLLLFKNIINNVVGYSTVIKVYSYKYYEGETLKLHLKPYAKKSGEIGMFDVVSNNFFENKGTGTFVYEEL